MRRRRLKPLVLPLALLGAGGVTAGLAEATAASAATLALYGMVRLASDLVLLIGTLWLGVAILGVVTLRAADRTEGSPVSLARPRPPGHGSSGS